MSLDYDVRHLLRTKQSMFRRPYRPYLLFDAGGTLVFPDQPFLIRQAQACGIELSAEQLFNGYCNLIYTLDCQARDSNEFPDVHWPQDYARDLLKNFDIDGATVKRINRAVQARSKRRSLWTFTFPWVYNTLSRLAKSGFGMSVISNSPGRTDRVLDYVGLSYYVDCVFDSKLLGVDKPDPGIFEKALRSLELEPSDALYVGDVFEVDVRGANAAGIGAVHLDPQGLYDGWPGVHLPNISYLPVWFVQYAHNPSNFDLFPFGCQTQTNMQTEQHDEDLAEPPIFSSCSDEVV